MTSIIIDGKNIFGKRISVSIPTCLYSFWLARCDNDRSDSFRFIRSKMASGYITSSSSAQSYITYQIADPVLTILQRNQQYTLGGL